MLSQKTLLDMARNKYEESKILLKSGKYDGAVYLCGYSLECMLKRRIILLLDWGEYPNTKKDFEQRTSLRTHDLDILLSFSGLENKVKQDPVIFADWNKAKEWNSEIRYKEIGGYTKDQAESIIESVKNVNNYLIKI
jgi:HEPN domain-containing protein